MKHRRLGLGVVLAILLHGLVGLAQADASGATAGIQPPVLVERAEATYPEVARAERLEATVVLRLLVDAHGHVSEAEVLEPAGHGFDDAARDAALRSQFRPALRNGKPTAARVLYAYEFRPPAKPEPEPLVVQPVAKSAPVAAPAAQANALTVPAREGPVQLTVTGERSEARRLQESAEAVNVVTTRSAQRETADLGEVLARTQGLAVRRSGGLGSDTRFSLNGLYDKQIRFFLDGVPLDIAGFPLGVANVPLNLVDRVEVYRGVVPIRFGADALGGAVNLASDEAYHPHFGASYQVGSFGTHRVTADGRWRHDPSGLVLGAVAFVDATKNNYDVDVEIPDGRGRPMPATVPRFHDAYRASGGMFDAGVVDRPWARRLLLRGFYSTYHKELQHNLVMSVPYGEVTYGETVVGATARYEADLRDDLKLELVASYARATVDYSDQSQWIYDWNGRRIRGRHNAGEIDDRPRDQSIWTHHVFGRAQVEYELAAAHTLRGSFTPAFATRTGVERLQANPDARDPLTAKRDLFVFVSGVEYQLELFEGRLSNILFVKDYLYDANTEELLPGGVYRRRDTDSHTRGGGNALRFRITPWLYAKASYEYATRLPQPSEVFGNGVRIVANLGLRPEVSHNANLGPRLEAVGTPAGDLTLDVNAFLRESRELIVLLPGSERTSMYQNVYLARALGIESAVSWVLPHRYLSLDGMLTWQDVRNAASLGTFGTFNGDRLPNRPYLFASFGGRLRFEHVLDPHDALEPFYHGRYVHEFYRAWESVGLRESKDKVGSQLTHSAGVSWLVTRGFARVASTVEVDNLTDAKVFDNFGLQRPGRAIHLKVTGEI